MQLTGRQTQFYIDIIYGVVFLAAFTALLVGGMDARVATFMGGLILGYFLRVWENMSVYERILREEVAAEAEKAVADEAHDAVAREIDEHVAEEAEEAVADEAHDAVAREIGEQVPEEVTAEIGEQLPGEVTAEVKRQVANEVAAEIKERVRGEVARQIDRAIERRLAELAGGSDRSEGGSRESG